MTEFGTNPPFSARRLNDGLRQEQPLEATSNIIFGRLKLVSSATSGSADMASSVPTLKRASSSTIIWGMVL